MRAWTVDSDDIRVARGSRRCAAAPYAGDRQLSSSLDRDDTFIVIGTEGSGKRCSSRRPAR